MSEKTEHQAFPSEGGEWSGLHADPGMTMREYFAGQALVGLCAAMQPGEVIDVAEGIKGGKFIVGAAWALADKMIEDSPHD